MKKFTLLERTLHAEYQQARDEKTKREKRLDRIKEKRLGQAPPRMKAQNKGSGRGR